MTNEVNPFQPPHTPRNTESIDFPVFFHWAIVFAMNMIAPAFLGWGLSERAGRMGIGLACTLLLSFGWGLCYLSPSSAKLLNIGSLIVAFSQMFPVLQIVIGSVSLKITRILSGHTPPEGDADTEMAFLYGPLTSEQDGFIVTLCVGAGLIVCSGTLGFLIGLFQPKSTDPVEQHFVSLVESKG